MSEGYNTNETRFQLQMRITIVCKFFDHRSTTTSKGSVPYLIFDSFTHRLRPPAIALSDSDLGRFGV